MQTEALKPAKSPTAFRSIGEAAGELGLQTHVLRFWETKFRQLSPVKRRDGRRFYRPEDMAALRAIQMLVHGRGMTIKGAQGLLNEQGVDAVLNGEARLMPVSAEAAISPADSPARELQARVREAFDAETGEDGQLETGTRTRLEGILSDITDMKRRLDAVRTRRAA